MRTLATSLPRDTVGLIGSIDLSGVRSAQGWLLHLMRKDGPALVRLFWRMLGREQDVLDAYQECFCKLIAQFERDGQVPHRGYAFRTAMNVALDARRRRKVRSDHLESVAHSREPDRTDPSPHAVATGELVDALRLAIASLPERLREVIVLRDLAEMSYRDVARVLNLTSGTARVYRREAIQRLSASLSE